jgi:hypothetical protein
MEFTMLDLNHRSPDERLNAVIDAGILKEARKRTPRNYLGASLIGKPCSRAIQFDFFHVEPDGDKGFSAQTYRVFAVGHSLEDLAIEWFRLAGFDLRTQKKDGCQFGFSTAGGRFAGHIDGVLCGGPPMTIAFPALWECKTMHHKKFKEASEKGITKSHPQYVAQISIYQAYLELTENPAILTAINKDTQKLYHEAIPFNPELAQKTSDKAATILQACDAGELLPRISNDPAYFECRWCFWCIRCHQLPV